MEQKTRQLTVRETTMVKGVAIILLLMYHCFSAEERLMGAEVTFLFSKEKEMWLCNAANVCVGMFAVLSSYGITISSRKYFQEKKISPAYFVHRLFSLLSGFFPIYILCYLGCEYFNTMPEFGQGLNRMVYVCLDFLGVAWIVSSPSLCTTWWYMGFTILVIFLVPVFLKLTEAVGNIEIMGLFLILSGVLQMPYSNMTKWIFAVLLGCIAAKEQWFEKMGQMTFGNSKITWAINTVILGFLIWLGQSSMGFHNLIFSTRGVTPFFVVFYCYRYLCCGIAGKVFFFLGKHSMNIFLVHTFIRATWFSEFTYSFRYPVVIVLVLLGCSILVSVVVEGMKKYLGYEKLMKAFEKKLMAMLEHTNRV